MQQVLFYRHLFKAFVFFAISLIVLTVVRVSFFWTFKTPEITFTDFLPAAWMGLRVDAKWLSTLILPAWILFCFSLWKTIFWKLSVYMAAFAMAISVIVAVINFGFFDFYRTPINSIVFGLFQDDTKAILYTLIKDWPIVQYVICLIILICLPLFIARLAFNSFYLKHSAWNNKWFVLFVLVSVSFLFGILIRGSFGTFPLRQQNYAVSPNVFVNSTVPGGMASLYEAWKELGTLELKGGSEQALTNLGFKNSQEAELALDKGRKTIADFQVTKDKPNVVIAIMESMGRDTFDLHSENYNVLGNLETELRHAIVFRNGISVNSGTFPSLEGILFDTPLTPLTQSRYGKETFSFSKVKDFKDAGYKTVFLTSGSESWRQIDINFPQQGFDLILGSNAIKARYPEAQSGTWGIGDAWMFRMANEILAESNKDGKPLFLVMLSATNHPPHAVPDGENVGVVEVPTYPTFVTDDRFELMTDMVRTYRYASNALGNFVRFVRDQQTQKETVIVATGDHNARLRYASEGWWHHVNGVPVIFWLPESLEQLSPEMQAGVKDRWVSHRDIMPTLEEMILGKKVQKFEGRNLFSKDDFDVALSYAGLGKTGWGIGEWGAVSLGEGGKLTCYRWLDWELVKTECSGEALRFGHVVRAGRALIEKKIRSDLLGENIELERSH